MQIDAGAVLSIVVSAASLLGMVLTGSRVISRTETSVAVLAEQHRQIKESIDALTQKVGEQNGRIGKSETAIAVLGERRERSH